MLYACKKQILVNTHIVHATRTTHTFIVFVFNLHISIYLWNIYKVLSKVTTHTVFMCPIEISTTTTTTTTAAAATKIMINK